MIDHSSQSDTSLYAFDLFKLDHFQIIFGHSSGAEYGQEAILNRLFSSGKHISKTRSFFIMCMKKIFYPDTWVLFRILASSGFLLVSRCMIFSILKLTFFICGGGVDQPRLPSIIRWVSCLYVHLTLFQLADICRVYWRSFYAF